MGRYELMRCDPVDEWLTIDALASATASNSELLEKFVAYGLIEPVRIDNGIAWFDLGAVRRVRMIGRLRRDLGINLSGIAVVFDLLARIENLQRELTALHQAQYDQVDGLVQSPQE